MRLTSLSSNFYLHWIPVAFFLTMNAKVEQCAVPIELESLASTYCRQVFKLPKRL